MAEFHAWLVKTRIETEQQLLARENYLHEIAPFAQAGLTEVDTPQELPFIVSKFCQTALDVIDLKRQLALLNVYYLQAANEQCSSGLVIEPGNEAEVMQLW